MPNDNQTTKPLPPCDAACSPALSDTPLTDLMVETHILENRNHPATDWVPASFARQLERMLRAVLKTAHQGRYTAIDYMAVVRQFDEVADFLENANVDASPPEKTL